MRIFFFVFALIGLTVSTAYGQFVEELDSGTGKFEIPDIPGYHTLKCDFHMHTIFSDGVVWPYVRVDEALAEGLDVISITDHVEYSRKEVEDNHMVPYEIAKKRAKETELMLILGGELSASHDHFNALFLENTDAPDLRDTLPANRIAAANRQGAFVFWNHPGWLGKTNDGVTRVPEEFIEMIEAGQIRGLEVCNGNSYYEEAHLLALEHGLTLLGNSDIHGISYSPYQPLKHRTITLVFSQERSVEGIREALENQRTVVYQGDHLVGSEEFLQALVLESLELEAEYYKDKAVAKVSIKNPTDFIFVCENKSAYGLFTGIPLFILKPHTKTDIYVKTLERLPEFDLDLKILNALVEPGKSLEMTIPVKDLLPAESQ
ncbi:MAG: Sb-PDE family phosphodiesterase [Bacteroidota bacterium]